MIDYKKVEASGTFFVNFFMDLNLASKDNGPTFIENLIGFIYAFKLILKGVEVSNVLTNKQIDNICNELSKAVGENISKEKTQELFNIIKEFKAEEKDVGADK